MLIGSVGPGTPSSVWMKDEIKTIAADVEFVGGRAFRL